jgi:hypothetical protein
VEPLEESSALDEALHPERFRLARSWGRFFWTDRQLMGWMAPSRHRSAKMVVVKDHQQREPSMGDITTIGLDLAKNVFQVHAVDEAGSVVMRKRLRRGQVRFLCGDSVVPRRAGSLRDGASLGARVNCAWP